MNPRALAQRLMDRQLSWMPQGRMPMPQPAAAPVPAPAAGAGATPATPAPPQYAPPAKPMRGVWGGGFMGITPDQMAHIKKQGWVPGG